MNTVQEKAMHFLTALADVYRDEENRELEAFSKMEFSDCKANGGEPALPKTQKEIVEWLRQMRYTECNCPLCQSKSTEKE